MISVERLKTKEHVLRTWTEGLTAPWLGLRPKPRRSNNKSKTYLMRVGVVGGLRLTMKSIGNRAERHPERADEASIKHPDKNSQQTALRGFSERKSCRSAIWEAADSWDRVGPAIDTHLLCSYALQQVGGSYG